MISIPFLVCLIGLIISLVFTKWQKVEDKWVADIGRICFGVGLFWTLSVYAGKVAF